MPLRVRLRVSSAAHAGAPDGMTCTARRAARCAATRSRSGRMWTRRTGTCSQWSALLGVVTYGVYMTIFEEHLWCGIRLWVPPGAVTKPICVLCTPSRHA
ncbi:hypothetical protein BC834DRAFT_879188 [Gloeopeniophorella convolvens]|nr:hypothetical protein BC834DRAFT_879188 [Gloeopeniophorella convolvens]